MATLVLSLQTSGVPWDQLSPRTQTELTQWITRETSNTAEIEHRTKQVQENTQYAPLTATVASLAVHDIERVATAVYLTADAGAADTERDDVLYKPRTEAELLIEFWEGIARYDTIVTFNGRRFVLPFLIHRSAVYRIRPSVHLLESRYLERQSGVRHVDLLDQLTFYGAQSRRPTLYQYCEAYELPLPPLVDASPSAAQTALKNAETVICVERLYEHWLAYFPVQDSDDILEF